MASLEGKNGAPQRNFKARVPVVQMIPPTTITTTSVSSTHTNTHKSDFLLNMRQHGAGNVMEEQLFQMKIHILFNDSFKMMHQFVAKS